MSSQILLTILQVEVWSVNASKVLKDMVYYMKLGLSRVLCYNIYSSKEQKAHFNNVVSEEKETNMTILLDRAFINLIAHTLENGEWQKAIRTMANNGLDRQQMYALCDKINFYPNQEFEKYARNIVASKKAKEALDSFFAKNI